MVTGIDPLISLSDCQCIGMRVISVYWFCLLWPCWIPCVFLFYVCCCLVTKPCLTPCNPVDCSTPGFPVLHYFPEFAQIHVHWVGDAIHPSHPLPPPSPSAFSLSQHQGLFQWVSCSNQVARVLEHQCFQRTVRVDWFDLLAVQGEFPCPPPMDHILPELFTMTCSSWMVPHDMAHSFIEFTSHFTSTRLWSMKRIFCIGYQLSFPPCFVLSRGNHYFVLCESIAILLCTFLSSIFLDSTCENIECFSNWFH